VIFNTDNAYASLVMNSDMFIRKMTVYIISDIYIYIYIYMIQGNSHSSTVWSTRDITLSQQG
jgi:hypothetical protein